MKLKRNERSQDIKNFEGLYAITTHGRVWSYRRKIWLKQYDNSHGYMLVALRVNGDVDERKVHRLVAEAFIDNPENKPQVNHLNGIKADCRAVNLEFCTARENMQHASDMGLNKTFKLSYEDKILICQIFDTFGITKTRLARIFGVSVPAICYILKTYTSLAVIA